MATFPARNVFVSTREDASLGFAGIPEDDFPGSQLPNIDVDGVYTLQSVIFADGLDIGDLPSHTTVYVWTQSHGPWLNECPDEMVEALAAIQPASYRDIGLRWWERLWEDDEEDVKEEMIAQAPVDSLEREVRVLADLARLAIRDGKNLYWVAPGC